MRQATPKSICATGCALLRRHARSLTILGQRAKLTLARQANTCALASLSSKPNNLAPPLPRSAGPRLESSSGLGAHFGDHVRGRATLTSRVGHVRAGQWARPCKFRLAERGKKSGEQLNLGPMLRLSSRRHSILGLLQLFAGRPAKFRPRRLLGVCRCRAKVPLRWSIDGWLVKLAIHWLDWKFSSQLKSHKSHSLQRAASQLLANLYPLQGVALQREAKNGREKTRPRPRAACRKGGAKGAQVSRGSIGKQSGLRRGRECEPGGKSARQLRVTPSSATCAPL